MRNMQEIKQIFDSFYGQGWQRYDVNLLFHKTGEILGLKTDVDNGEVGNDEIPKYLSDKSPSVCLYVCNVKTSCGRKQIVYFILDKMISGDIVYEIKKGSYLFEIDSEQRVISGDDEDHEPDANERMSDYPELYENMQSVWEMLDRK